MSNTRRIAAAAIMALLVFCIWSSVSRSQEEPNRGRLPAEDSSVRKNVPAFSEPTPPDPSAQPVRPDPPRPQAKPGSMRREEKLVRDVYARLMRYQSAARDESEAREGVSAQPEDYLTFNLHRIHTGPVAEIYAKPLIELVTPRTGDVLNVKANYLSANGGPAHAYYEVDWTTAPSGIEPTLENDRIDPALPRVGLTVGQILLQGGDRLADVEKYTSYEVTVHLNGKQRTYRALILHHANSASDIKANEPANGANAPARRVTAEILDQITSEMNTVLNDESPRVRSPWTRYVNTSLYAAVTRSIMATKAAGLALRPADALLGYLPGDGVTPSKMDTGLVALSVPCDPQPTVVIKEVGFKADHKIKKFSDDSTIDPNDDSPTWVSGRSTNNEFLVAYTKGTHPTMFAKITVQQASSSYTTATVRVKHGSTVLAEMPNVNVAQNGDVPINNIGVTVDLAGSSLVKMSRYTLTWEISFAGSSWTSIGNSGEHEVHWLNGAPIEPAFKNPDTSEINPDRTYSGLYDLALQHATAKTGDGSPDIDQIAERITSAFLTDNLLIYNPGRPSQNRHPLSIYLDTNHAQQCSDNVTLLRGLLRSIGIDSTVNYFWGGNPTTLVSHWFVEPGSTPNIRTGFPNGSNTTSQYPRPVRNANPANPYFTFHSTLRVGSGKSFDPSYGITEAEVSLIQAVNASGQCLTGSAANAARVIRTTLFTQGIDFGSVCSSVSRSSLFMTQVVPTSMTAGASYPVSVTFRNTGTTTWTSADMYRLGSQNPQDNSTWGLNRVNLPASVPPGNEVTFTFYVTSPSSAGTYNFQWRMVQDGVEWFGDTAPNVVIDVSSSSDICNPPIAELRACLRLGGFWDCGCQGVGIP